MHLHKGRFQHQRHPKLGKAKEQLGTKGSTSSLTLYTVHSYRQIYIYIYTYSPDERNNVWCFRIFHVSGICLDKAALSTLLAKHTELDVQETSHDPTASEPWNDAWTGLVLKYPQISLFRPMK